MAGGGVYTPSEMKEDMCELKEDTQELVEDEMKEHCNEHHKKENDMDPTALMALVQSMNSKGASFSDIAAACKKEGGDGFMGGGGIGFIVLILFFMMMNNGGFGNNANKTAAAEMAATAGFDLQTVTSMYDRHSATLQAVNAGFASGQTALCSSIAEVMGAVRNQGDRNYDATRNVGDTVRDCCCKVEAALAAIACEIKGVGRDVRESAALTQARIELEALKSENSRAAMECRIVQQQKDCCCEMNQRFDQLNCKLDNQSKDAVIASQAEKLERLREEKLAQQTIHQFANWQLANYVPTRTPIVPPVA